MSLSFEELSIGDSFIIYDDLKEQAETIDVYQKVFVSEGANAVMAAGYAPAKFRPHVKVIRLTLK